MSIQCIRSVPGGIQVQSAFNTGLIGGYENRVWINSIKVQIGPETSPV